MGFFDRLFSRGAAPGPVSGPVVRQRIARGPASHARRSFQAGTTDRLTASWTVTDETINQSLVRTLRTMRARSRDFERNSEFGRKFFSLVQTNIIGDAGIALKMDCRRPDGSVDEQDCQRIERAHARWWKRGELDVTGKLSGKAFERLVTKMMARDGEVLVRLLRGTNMGIHRIRVQVLPGHLLEELHNVDLANGNSIRMGVELDPYRRPVAYHIRLQPGLSDIYGQAAQRYERVPAEDIIHLFVPEEAEQWRGVPWAFVALRGNRQLDQFDEAALIAANVGASQMGFFQQKDAEAGAIGDPDSEDANGDFIEQVEPGSWNVVPDGYEVAKFDPRYPNEVFDPFTKAVARKIATGLLTSYHTLTGDLTGVNYSSIRAGTLDDRDSWKVLQDVVIEGLRGRLFSEWLVRALQFDPDLRTMPMSKLDKFDAPLFYARRWDWVDPQSDMTANEKAVGLGIKSRAQIIRERGQDPEQVWKELDVEKARGFMPPAASGFQQPQQTSDTTTTA